jgi:hypothetical protein
MSRLFSDTRPEAEQVLLELLRQAPAWRKLELVAQMNETVRILVMSGLQQRYPHASPEELRRRLADALLGAELAARVYGPLQTAEPADAS